MGREQGEYFFLSAILAQFDRLYFADFGGYRRPRGITSEFFLQEPFADFPDVVIRPERRRRIYVNGLLARNEPGSDYAPNRKLWVRERHGHYLPNPGLRLRSLLADGVEAWHPLHELMNLAGRDAFLAQGRRPSSRG